MPNITELRADVIRKAIRWARTQPTLGSPHSVYEWPNPERDASSDLLDAVDELVAATLGEDPVADA